MGIRTEVILFLIEHDVVNKKSAIGAKKDCDVPVRIHRNQSNA